MKSMELSQRVLSEIKDNSNWLRVRTSDCLRDTNRIISIGVRQSKKKLTLSRWKNWRVQSVHTKQSTMRLYLKENQHQKTDIFLDFNYYLVYWLTITCFILILAVLCVRPEWNFTEYWWIVLLYSLFWYSWSYWFNFFIFFYFFLLHSTFQFWCRNSNYFIHYWFLHDLLVCL